MMLAAVRIGLWLAPFRLMRRFPGDRRAHRTRKTHPSAPAARERIRAIEAAADYIPGATCLVKALAAQALLGRAGCESTLRIGVLLLGDGKLKAHAWLEHDGQTILGGNVPGIDDFKPLPELGGSSTETGQDDPD